MTPAGVLAIVLFFAYFSCLMYSFVVKWKIIQAINQSRPSEKPLDMFSFPFRPSWHWEIFRMYRSFYPSGNLTRRYWITTGLGFLFFAGLVLCIFSAAQ